jgi:hypothetical protein
VNVNVRVPCGQGKTGEGIFIYVIPAKCGIKAENFPSSYSHASNIFKKNGMDVK